MRSSIYGVVLLACSVSSACGDESEGDEPMGRGSAACQDFQDATCDFASDRCGVVARATCDTTFRGIRCVDDAQATACANALNEATCGSASPQCELDAIVDRPAAIASCEALYQAFCDHNATCGGQTVGECMADAAAMGFDCSQALSIDLRYESCLEAIDALMCGSPTPAVCREVVLVLPPGVSLS